MSCVRCNATEQLMPFKQPEYMSCDAKHTLSTDRLDLIKSGNNSAPSVFS